MPRIWLRVLLAMSLIAVTQMPVIIDTPSARSDPAVSADSYNPVFVVLDTSGSMSEEDSSGTVKLEGARGAVLDLIGALDPKTPFGMISYPGNSESVNGCPEGEVKIKIGTGNQSAASAAVRALVADGETPTGPALRHAADLVESSKTQKGTIVLVSDGESNCGEQDVCEVAEQLSQEGVEVSVNTVGFLISDEGRSELTCIANATGGTYVDAEDEERLKEALQDLSGARLTLTVDVPGSLSAVSGTGSEGSKARLTVTNDGRKVANDVRLSLDFRDSTGSPGAILVPRPVRFLGGLEPGRSRSVEMVIRPDASRLGPFTWIAAATASNAAPKRAEGAAVVVEPFGTAGAPLTGLLDGVNSVVILGDSYSSGQGANDYLAGTADEGPGDNGCRRSDETYGRVLFEGATIIACGGAVTANFYDQQRSGKVAVPPQLAELRKIAVSDRSPDAVFLSIGGNDVDFVGTVISCSLGTDHQCEWTFAENKIPPIANSLRRVYRDVNRAINDAEARRSRDGGYAPIIVVPYPRILPASSAGVSEANDCQGLIDATEAQYLNRFLDLLNTEIEAAVSSLKSEGVPVYFAKDVIPAFQPSHTVCDGADSYAVFDSDGAAVLRRGTNQPPEMLHPNAMGYEAMARAIAAWSSSQLMAGDPKASDYIAVEAKKLNAFESAVAAATMGPADIYLAGGDAKVDGTGYAPSSTVVYRLDSVPRIVGSTVVDDGGAVAATVTIPPDTRPGRHTLHAVGFGPNGESRDDTTTIWVAPRNTPYAALAALLGLIGVGIGALGMRGNRKIKQQG